MTCDQCLACVQSVRVAQANFHDASKCACCTKEFPRRLEIFKIFNLKEKNLLIAPLFRIV